MHNNDHNHNNNFNQDHNISHNGDQNLALKVNWQQATFFVSVNELAQLPQTQAEIAIVGRSNCGKSSLLNVLTNQIRLAYTSKTPGRTQLINYFTVQGGIFLVDLPGYGYAKVPTNIRKHWGDFLASYLHGRSELSGLVLIMDARHPLKELDWQMIDFFGLTNKPMHLVLSKADKLTNQEKKQVLTKVDLELKKHNVENYSLQLFSALKRLNVSELQAKLNSFIEAFLVSSN